MRGRAVDGLREACRGPIALTIVVGTEMRASLADFLSEFFSAANKDRNFPIFAPVAHGAAHNMPLPVQRVERKPIGCPFPYVSDHVVKTKSIRWKRANGGCPVSGVLARLLPRKFALPIIGHLAGHLALAHRPRQNALASGHRGRQIPIPLRSAIPCLPIWHRHRVFIRDLHDRVIHDVTNRTARTQWMPPIGSEHEFPPEAWIIQRHRSGSWL